MSDDLDEAAIKLLKYIISYSRNGDVSISLEDASKQLEMNIKDILDTLRKLERMKTIKLMNPPTPDFILKTLVSEAIEYDLMYLSEEIDEQKYKKQLEEIMLRPSLTDLPVDKTCITSNIVDLKETLNGIEYLLQVISEIIGQPSTEMKRGDKQKIISDFITEFLSHLIYIHNFLMKLKLVGEVVSESLENFKRLRIEAKTVASAKLREKYEESRKNIVKKAMNLFFLGSILYPEALYVVEEKNCKCDTCGKDLQIYWKHCKFCGIKINQIFLPIDLTENKHAVCYNCKNILPIGSKVCPKCGFNLEDEIKRLESNLLSLKGELELLNARKIIEGDILTNDIKEKEMKFKEIELHLEELKKAFQTPEYASVGVFRYFTINTATQKFYSILTKKITAFKDLMGKAGVRIDESFEESTKDILQNEKEVMDCIKFIAFELPLSLQEYALVARKDESLLTCNSCGFKNDGDALFCIECGTSLDF